MKKRVILNLSLLVVFLLAALNPASGQEKQNEKIQKSNRVLIQFKQMKENIPSQLLQQAQGIVIIPNLINAGLGVGGKRGKGVALVRNSDGSWSNPVFITLTGGSIGFQAGVQSIDLVLIFKNRETLEKIGNGTFTLGGGAAVAAGPVGRSASANTDFKFEAEVYSYSRSKGLFAGISLNGTSIDVDESANRDFYGSNASSSAIFSGSMKASAHSGVQNLKKNIAALAQ